MNIFLIGYRGTGKTTVGEQLAQRLGWCCVDADAEVEKRAGKTIAEIFDQEGEDRFRQLESAVICDLAGLDRHVVALGGGAVLCIPNRLALRDRGNVVWLRATPERIAERLAKDATTASSRPNLTATGGLAEIRQVLRERIPIYRAISDLEVDTDTKTPGAVADEIIAWLRKW